MKEGVFVRFLIPCQTREGKIEYRIETRRIRLPLRRDDRLLLDRRMSD